MNETAQKTQSERLAEELKKLRVNVTAADRKAYIDRENITRPTVSRYLHGHVLDADRAADMLEFFRSRIAEREKALTK